MNAQLLVSLVNRQYKLAQALGRQFSRRALVLPAFLRKTRSFYLDPCRRSFSPHSSSASQRQSSTRLSNVSTSLSRFIRSRSSAIFRWESWCQRFGGGVPGGNPKKSSRISSNVNPISRRAAPQRDEKAHCCRSGVGHSCASAAEESRSARSSESRRCANQTRARRQKSPGLLPLQNLTTSRAERHENSSQFS